MEIVWRSISSPCSYICILKEIWVFYFDGENKQEIFKKQKTKMLQRIQEHFDCFLFWLLDSIVENLRWLSEIKVTYPMKIFPIAELQRTIHHSEWYILYQKWFLAPSILGVVWPESISVNKKVSQFSKTVSTNPFKVGGGRSPDLILILSETENLKLTSPFLT